MCYEIKYFFPIGKKKKNKYFSIGNQALSKSPDGALSQEKSMILLIFASLDYEETKNNGNYLEQQKWEKY